MKSRNRIRLAACAALAGFAVSANPIFKGGVLASQKPLATGAGHHSVICAPGTDDWYICYHRRPIPSEGRDHRVVCIDRMEFDADGGIKPVVMTTAAAGR